MTDAFRVDTDKLLTMALAFYQSQYDIEQLNNRLFNWADEITSPETWPDSASHDNYVQTFLGFKKAMEQLHESLGVEHDKLVRVAQYYNATERANTIRDVP